MSFLLSFIIQNKNEAFWYNRQMANIYNNKRNAIFKKMQKKQGNMHGASSQMLENKKVLVMEYR